MRNMVTNVKKVYQKLQLKDDKVKTGKQRIRKPQRTSGGPTLATRSPERRAVQMERNQPVVEKASQT